jgi:hypothetical protein
VGKWLDRLREKNSNTSPEALTKLTKGGDDPPPIAFVSFVSAIPEEHINFQTTVEAPDPKKNINTSPDGVPKVPKGEDEPFVSFVSAIPEERINFQTADTTPENTLQTSPEALTKLTKGTTGLIEPLNQSETTAVVEEIRPDEIPSTPEPLLVGEEEEGEGTFAIADLCATCREKGKVSHLVVFHDGAWRCWRCLRQGPEPSADQHKTPDSHDPEAL